LARSHAIDASSAAASLRVDKVVRMRVQCVLRADFRAVGDATSRESKNPVKENRGTDRLHRWQIGPGNMGDTLCKAVEPPGHALEGNVTDERTRVHVCRCWASVICKHSDDLPLLLSGNADQHLALVAMAGQAWVSGGGRGNVGLACGGSAIQIDVGRTEEPSRGRIYPPCATWRRVETTGRIRRSWSGDHRERQSVALAGPAWLP
jgi:hypothetical protein